MSIARAIVLLALLGLVACADPERAQRAARADQACENHEGPVRLAAHDHVVCADGMTVPL